MKLAKICLFSVLALWSISNSLISCDDRDTIYISQLSPSQVLASKQWKTTIVRDAQGNDVTAQNGGFVGNAFYHTDGTFKITGFDGVLRSMGDWSITIDGKKRILIGKNLNGSGEIIFTRVVDIISLTPAFFVYSITVNGEKLTVEHIPL